jgi:hypothetical protein
MTTATASTAEAAVAAFLSGFAALIPEVAATVQAGGKNVGADFSLAEDLAGVFASAAANVGGTVGAIGADVNSWLPFTRAVTSSVAAQVAPAAPAPAAS